MPGPQPNLQQQRMAAQAERAQVQIEGAAAGGLVKAVVTGQGDLVSVEVSASVAMGPLSVGMGGMGLPGF